MDINRVLIIQFLRMFYKFFFFCIKINYYFLGFFFGCWFLFRVFLQVQICFLVFKFVLGLVYRGYLFLRWIVGLKFGNQLEQFLGGRVVSYILGFNFGEFMLILVFQSFYLLIFIFMEGFVFIVGQVVEGFYKFKFFRVNQVFGSGV